MKNLKTGDKVVVVSGSNKGKEGKITKILDNKVIVEGVNIVKKHLKPKNKGYDSKDDITADRRKTLYRHDG